MVGGVQPMGCEQCGPEWSAGDIRDTPLRSLSLPQLVAVHVMSLGADALRYFFPRLMELMLQTPSPVLDFRLEEASVRELADAIWSEMLTTYPLPLGYFSDCPSTLDLLDWCGQPNHGLSRLAAER